MVNLPSINTGGRMTIKGGNDYETIEGCMCSSGPGLHGLVGKCDEGGPSDR